MKKEIKNYNKNFENIRQKTKEGEEFWSARDLQPILEYSKWDKFKPVILKAIEACEKSKNPVELHFPRMGKKVKLGMDLERNIEDYDFHLSRYACYLVVQNGDSSKPVIAMGQT